MHWLPTLTGLTSSGQVCWGLHYRWGRLACVKLSGNCLQPYSLERDTQNGFPTSVFAMTLYMNIYMLMCVGVWVFSHTLIHVLYEAARKREVLGKRENGREKLWENQNPSAAFLNACSHCHLVAAYAIWLCCILWFFVFQTSKNTFLSWEWM